MLKLKRELRTRILLAGGEPSLRQDLKAELLSRGYSVVAETEDGNSTVNTARELRPDIVLLDRMMPELEDIPTAEVLNKEKIAPVILLTTSSDPGLIAQAKQAGVVGFIIKPWREFDLAPAIEVTLAHTRKLNEIEQEVQTLREQLETRKLIDQAKGLLMDIQGLKEQEAFKRIQRLSMSSRKSMREVAEAVLLTHRS